MKYIIIILIVLFSFNVHANKIMTVKKGDVVLFDGHLIDSEGLTKIKQKNLEIQKKCKLDKEFEIKKINNLTIYKIRKCEENSKIEINGYKKIVQTQKKEIEKLRKIIQRPDLTPLWVSVGVVGGVVGAIIVVVIVQNVKISF